MLKNPSGHPIVVHCSAGIGRTCTLIGIELLLKRIRQRRDATGAQLMMWLRDRRAGAIQKGIQFVFLHLVVIKLLCEEGVMKGNDPKVVEFEKKYQRLLKKQREAQRKKEREEREKAMKELKKEKKQVSPVKKDGLDRTVDDSVYKTLTDDVKKLDAVKKEEEPPPDDTKMHTAERCVPDDEKVINTIKDDLAQNAAVVDKTHKEIEGKYELLDSEYIDLL
ncbi:hypothetical protein DICVIV_13562 [Dictyocaulus viviparus]|uniref:Protein-tyrosine phosphatase n=1 Tax=Dictyocaulus viviparus TaxID=29172 RepID=A0A0D8X7G8_DICVI|nr:hypothetical protein DICVIV_13562 [Dictyocaulus viviparus]